MATKESTCLTCGKIFKIDNWRVGKAKYCSPKCYTIGRTSSKSYNKPRKCKDCGKEFLPTNWYQKSCSRSCFLEHARKTENVNCKICSKEFHQSRLGQKYCSRKCSSLVVRSIDKKPKHMNLDTVWSKSVKERANNKCEVCGKETGLNSHHIFSRSNKRVRWDIDNGICVCVSHHVFGLFSAHKSPIEFVEWLKEYRGIEWYERLRVKAKLTEKYTKPNKEQESQIREELLKVYKKQYDSNRS